jgi:O-acetylhomoserine (thiol)-lyase
VNNPTVFQFEIKVNELEGGIGAVACSSGMAAITCAVLAFVKNGETLLSSSSLFGGTYSLFGCTMARMGIRVKYFDPTRPDMIHELMDDSVRVVFTETIGNPKIDVADIKAISDASHKYRLPLIVDNTVTTPCLLRAANYEVDVIVHSSSKYFDGHGRAIGGCIVDMGTPYWDIERYEQLEEPRKNYGMFALLSLIRNDLMINLGCCQSPTNAAIHLTGIETLAIRMQKHCENALALSEFLSQHKKVKKVHYPGLENDPHHKCAHDLFDDCYGGLMTFEVESHQVAFNIINKLKLAQNLANIGDVRTLVIHPASTIYVNFSPEEQVLMGVTPELVRVSVGIEDKKDIINDFKNALYQVEA